MTDPISDMLSRIRNAIIARHKSVRIPSSNIKSEILRVLKEEGYIKDIKTAEENKFKYLDVELKYHGSKKKSVVKKLTRVSKPSRRVYVGSTDIPRVRGGLGTSIISTSKGIMAGRTAREQKLGGEFICTVM
ncbi:MAG: 30S ribosomal protein S8 [Candidatus Dadabacteria bacterium]|nr:30S ribosomal protein S8 [Candidatus Dadabacteria bacterium]NIS08361.1 30S ribosomal protein S8 [Candidatus Dadabacteria bacterium]NIV42222.1 30S ribosomal protein S8 [Candidatus Dadabacteria bacterium]NIX16399.1 30S ribosomal protein S8 [Candidatus Dadabacteria bacterium]NIY21878.1 30S ribosomal protein S8 [Candidatus Dadabacteria bacterium]